VCGIEIPIYREPDLRDSEGALLDGHFLPTPRPRILIREGLTKSVEKDTLIHELGHAFAVYSGLRDFFAGQVRKSVDVADFEETIIRILTPHIGGLVWLK
jgi:hypothetical protein